MFELSASQTASPKKPRSVFCEKKKVVRQKSEFRLFMGKHGWHPLTKILEKNRRKVYPPRAPGGWGGAFNPQLR